MWKNRFTSTVTDVFRNWIIQVVIKEWYCPIQEKKMMTQNPPWSFWERLDLSFFRPENDDSASSDYVQCKQFLQLSINKSIEAAVIIFVAED